MEIWQKHIKNHYSPGKTNSSPLKTDAWKTPSFIISGKVQKNRGNQIPGGPTSTTKMQPRAPQLSCAIQVPNILIFQILETETWRERGKQNLEMKDKIRVGSWRDPYIDLF